MNLFIPENFGGEDLKDALGDGEPAFCMPALEYLPVSNDFAPIRGNPRHITHGHFYDVDAIRAVGHGYMYQLKVAVFPQMQLAFVPTLRDFLETPDFLETLEDER